MSKISFTLLGSFDIRHGADAAPLSLGRKGQALVAYLALRPGVAHTRDKLAGLLWGDMAQEQARHSVRQALFALRRALPDAAAGVLVTSGESVALNADEVTVDAVRFETLAAAGTPEALGEAAGLYRGDLLEGLRVKEPPFEEWLAAERERLRRMVVVALERLLALRRERGDVDGAVQAAERLLAIDPAREAVHRALIHLYLETGKRGAALRQYQQCVRALQRELGVRPEAETHRLWEQIAGERAAPGDAADGEGARAAILVVEDEPVTRALLEGFLTVAGYDVAASTDGGDALFKLSRQRFDLIVSDIAMPTLDGLRLLELLSHNTIDTPVLFVTGQPGDALEIRGLELGAVDYLRKPIQKDVLLLRVKKALRTG